MDTKFWLEMLGYTASIIVAVSILMSSIVKLRIINLIGSALFSAYGFVIGAYPVGILNGFIAIINIVYLYKMSSKKEEYFKILEVRNENRYLHYFLDFYKNDIKKFFPQFEFKPDQNTMSFFVLRNLAVAGVFLAHKMDEKSIFVDLDFVIPEYRDFKVGHYILGENEAYFIKQGYTRIYTISKNNIHSKYLKKMGFVEKDENGKIYLVKNLKSA